MVLATIKEFGGQRDQQAAWKADLIVWVWITPYQLDSFSEHTPKHIQFTDINV